MTIVIEWNFRTWTFCLDYKSVDACVWPEMTSNHEKFSWSTVLLDQLTEYQSSMSSIGCRLCYKSIKRKVSPSCVFGDEPCSSQLCQFLIVWMTMMIGSCCHLSGRWWLLLTFGILSVLSGACSRIAALEELGSTVSASLPDTGLQLELLASLCEADFIGVLLLPDAVEDDEDELISVFSVIHKFSRHSDAYHHVSNLNDEISAFNVNAECSERYHIGPFTFRPMSNKCLITHISFESAATFRLFSFSCFVFVPGDNSIQLHPFRLMH